MFFYSQQHISDINKAYYQAIVNLVGKYMNGLQELAELNMQTMRTIIDESKNLPKDNFAENAEKLPEWQSSMLTQFPVKAASYNGHVRSIILSTGAEVMREARRQYEQQGSQVNAIFGEAIEKAKAASTATVERLQNSIAQSAQDSFDTTAKAVEDVSSEAASQASKATDEFVTAGEESLQTSTKSGNKR